MSRILAVTHDGKHHADEILAAYMLRARFGPSLHVERSSDRKVMERADILFDTGGVYDPPSFRFDHHGRIGNLPECPHRPKGYATAGLVWLAFGRDLCRKWMQHRRDSRWCEHLRRFPPAIEDNLDEVFHRVDREVVAAVDNWDTGAGTGKAPHGVIPVQWVIPYARFDEAASMLGIFMINQLNRYLDHIADLSSMRHDMMEEGVCEFYMTPLGVLVAGGKDHRVEFTVARKVVWERLREPVVGVISRFRRGDRWLFLLSDPLPEEIRVPDCFEVHPGRKMVFHNSRSFLLTFARGVYEKIDELFNKESSGAEEPLEQAEDDPCVPGGGGRGTPDADPEGRGGGGRDVGGG